MIAIVMGLETERENSSAILTAGEAFPDGTVIELLRDQDCPPKLSPGALSGRIPGNQT